MVRSASIVTAALVALAVSAAPALATRYATQSGSDTASCADVMHPCSLTTAVDGHGANSPSNDEEVIVEPGTYELPGPLTPTADNLDIQGPGLDLASIHATGGVVLRAAIPTSVTRLAIFGDIVDPGGTLDRLLMYPPPAQAGGVACQCTGGVLRNSLVIDTGTSGGLVGYVGTGNPTALGPPLTEDYRNDTFISQSSGTTPILIDHQGASVTPQFQFTAENVIAATVVLDAAGNPVAGPAAASVVQQAAGQTTTLTATHSDLVGTTSGATTDASDISVLPVFTRYPSDLRVDAGSPTVNSGVDDPLNGPLDLDGTPRAYGVTDMGAYEVQAAPPVVAPPAPILMPAGPGPSPQPSPVAGLIAQPKLTLYEHEVFPSNVDRKAPEDGKCTGVVLTCTVKGNLRATLPGHHSPSTVGTISGTLTPNHRKALTVKIGIALFDALEHRSGMHMNVSASITTTSGLGHRTQSFTLEIQTEPDHSRKPKHKSSKPKAKHTT